MLTQRLALKHGFHLSEYADGIEAFGTTSIKRKDAAKSTGSVQPDLPGNRSIGM